MITLEQYAQLTPGQQKTVKRDELKKIVDNQLGLLQNDPKPLAT